MITTATLNYYDEDWFQSVESSKLFNIHTSNIDIKCLSDKS